MDGAVFKLKGGEKEYDNFYHAVTVAEAKAEDDGRSVIICRKTVNSVEEVVKVFPDGSQDLLDKTFEP